MLPETATAAPLPLTDTDLGALHKARGWARFMAIVGFIGCGLFGLLMLVMVVTSLVVRNSTGASTVIAGTSLIGVGFGVAYFSLLLRYASGVAGHARGDTTALARAFWGLKVLWIITVVSYSLSIVMTIGMTVAQLLGLAPARPS